MFGTINLEIYFSKIAEIGWAVLPLDLHFAQQLKNELETKKSLNLFKSAGLANSLTETNIRNDLICWIEPEQATSCENQLIENLKNLTVELKNYFRISLDHFEAHYAFYPEGHFYHKHTDQKKENNHRYFSFVIYLNPNWNHDNGGRLLIYDKNETSESQPSAQIHPEIGQMILFRSDLVHEVEICKAERQSITGWIRTQ